MRVVLSRLEALLLCAEQVVILQVQHWHAVSFFLFPSGRLHGDEVAIDGNVELTDSIELPPLPQVSDFAWVDHWPNNLCNVLARPILSLRISAVI